MRFKKFFFVLSFFTVLFLIGISKNFFSFSFFSKNKNAQHFYFTSDADGARYAGMFFLASEDVINDKNSVLGEMIVLAKGETTLGEIKHFFNAHVVGEEKVEDLQIFYLHTSLLKKSIETEEKVFNLQVIFSKEDVKICYPINFGGF